jgi:DNA-binding MarR family transcriptional regulator
MSRRKLSKAEFEALAQFRYRLRRFLRFSEELTQRHGVTPLQYQLMLQLQGFPDRRWASVVELAERLQAKHHGVVALVTRCEDAGWVRRKASRDDRRRVEVHLTPQGLACVEQLARLHLAELRSIREGFVIPGLVDTAAGRPPATLTPVKTRAG